MSKLTAEIPLGEIEWIRLYIGGCKKTLAQVMAETGADYAINGGMWNPDGSACPLLKADGDMVSAAPWSAYGYGWDTGPDIRLLPNARETANFISCTCLIGPWGPVNAPSYGSAQGGRRGRSAIGIRDGCLMLWCSGDGTADAATPEELRDELSAAGWESAVMLDGGGSSQCDFQGQRIGSARKVHNIILVKRQKRETQTEEEEDKPVGDFKVCLDPGHGPGCANGSPDGGYKEQEFTWDMYGRVARLLEAQGVETVVTRTNYTYPGLSERTRIANQSGADCFMSLHSNAAGSDGWQAARGLMIYTSAGPMTAPRNVLAQALVDRFREAGVLVRESPILHELYTVLVKTEAPAVLIEYGFHTNKEDVDLLKDDAYRDKLAEATARGICNFLGVAGKDGQEEETAMTVEEAKRVLREKAGLSDTTITYLYNYRWGDDLLLKLAAAVEGKG